LCIEVVKKYDKYVIDDNSSHHMIAHIKLTKSWKENKVWYRKQTNPSH
jgi:hypothetical protein